MVVLGLQASLIECQSPKHRPNGDMQEFEKGQPWYDRCMGKNATSTCPW